MPSERVLRVLAQLTSDGESSLTTADLCAASVDVAAVSGGSLMLMSGDSPQGSLHTTDAVSAALEELQFTLGEGPCLEAHRIGHPVLVPDLRAERAPRWPGFAAGALDVGAAALFGFPLVAGTTRLGALNLYRDRPGGLSDDEHADMTAMAEVAARVVVDMQSQASPGAVAGELEAGANFHLVVHQASGMVSVQLGVSVEEALVRLRALAFAEGRPLGEVATAVVTRQLRLSGDGDGEGPEAP